MFLIYSCCFFKKWKALFKRAETACNEAKDNVKYLDELNELSKALYTTPPQRLPEHLRTILFSIRFIFSSSRYFNTTERATALLVKVTNRVVVAYRDYLTDGGTRSVWSFVTKEMISRIQVCLDVYESYKTAFADTQRAMAENPKEKPFGCSEANVFSRLLSFCERITKVFDIPLRITILYIYLNFRSKML